MTPTKSPEKVSSSFRGLIAPALVQDPIEGDRYLEDLPGTGRFDIPDTPECRLVTTEQQIGMREERFQSLASRLKRAQKRHAIKRLLVTSAIPGEGKTLISANLGITLALQQQRTLIIDGDLRRAGLSHLLTPSTRSGLTDWWETRQQLSSCLYRAAQLPLWVLPAGRYQDRPLNILQSAELAQALTELSGFFDWVIVDSPPLTPFADSGTWAALSDAVLFVVRRGVTPKKLLQEALRSLESNKIIATVLNDAIIQDRQYYDRYYQQAAGQVTPIQKS
jgi:capsular exopolysaccharide synthesis family protein